MCAALCNSQFIKCYVYYTMYLIIYPVLCTTLCISSQEQIIIENTTHDTFGVCMYSSTKIFLLVYLLIEHVMLFDILHCPTN
jgi:hypothetical protein